MASSGIVRWHSDSAQDAFHFPTHASIAELYVFCPACDFEHGFRVDLDGNGKWQRNNNDIWTFNDDYDSPTFQPSMLSNKGGIDEHHPICHSFLTDGKWEYLGDCTHDMAGQTVEVPDPDPDMSFQRRHGWHLYPQYSDS